MNSSIWVIFIPFAIVLSTFALVFFLLQAYRFSKKWRKNPLTGDLLRSPGESLRQQIEKLSEDINDYLIVVLFLPLVLYAAYLTQENVSGIFYVITALAIVVFSLFKLWKRLKERHNYRLGLDCETATGQELNQLMIEGYRVFHDFPVEEFNKKFNIDHIVVSPKGVFAIETKGKAKPLEKSSVVYDGETLKFSNDKPTKEPLEQARRNAKWLSKWLSSAVGENIEVYPAVALPGWWVEREGEGTGDVYVFNPKNPEPFFRMVGHASISEKLIVSIAHQLDQKCRDIEPSAYQQDKKNK